MKLAPPHRLPLQMINKKTLTVATVESVSIFLFNIIFVWKMYTEVGFFWSALILMIARIAWFYFVLSYADWMDEKREKITRYLQNMKARK
jgi:hypothetical protein